MNAILGWGLFLALGGVTVWMAGGMLITMSMYRAGLALMASFVALAGLFVLLDADLLAAIQVMMNIGGMMVMMLFMVMLMIDPGGEMMWDMKRKMHLPGPGALSMSMPRHAPRLPVSAPTQPAKALTTPVAAVWTCPMHPEIRRDGPGQCPICSMDLVPAEDPAAAAATTPAAAVWTCPMHPEIRRDGPGQCPICGMDLVPAEDTAPSPAADMHMGHTEGAAANGAAHAAAPPAGDAPMTALNPQQHYEMMAGMAMSTAQLPWAGVVGAGSALALIGLILTTRWPVVTAGPTGDTTAAVGNLLLSRYMIAFEGAAFLILAGIAGAVVFATRLPRDQSVAAAATIPAPAASGFAAPPTDGATAPQPAPVWTCPMHPAIRQDGPGQCPICGMDLVPAEAAAADTAPAHAGHTMGGRGGH